jgi:hypothetical protein
LGEIVVAQIYISMRKHPQFEQASFPWSPLLSRDGTLSVHQVHRAVGILCWDSHKAKRVVFSLSLSLLDESGEGDPHIFKVPGRLWPGACYTFFGLWNHNTLELSVWYPFFLLVHMSLQRQSLPCLLFPIFVSSQLKQHSHWMKAIEEILWTCPFSLALGHYSQPVLCTWSTVFLLSRTWF